MEQSKDDEGRAHPPAHELDAIAAGDENERATVHVASCEACARYVGDLREQAVRFRTKRDAQSFVARANASGERRARSQRWARTAWVTAPVLAAAAVILLVVRAHPLDGNVAGVGLLTDVDGRTESRFKGVRSWRSIRERAGMQERLVGPAFQVRGGDRVRVEVSTDREGPLSAGLLADDGQWAPLLAPSALEAGTHYSELAARFDDSPTRATLLVGTPDAVDLARQTHDFGGVVAWRVTSEPGP